MPIGRRGLKMWKEIRVGKSGGGMERLNGRSPGRSPNHSLVRESGNRGGSDAMPSIQSRTTVSIVPEIAKKDSQVP